MKWADYVISAVRYTNTSATGKRYISKCRVHIDKAENIGPFSEWSREEVIKMIDNGASFSTIYKNNGQWKKGEDIRKVKIGIYHYIKTDRNNIEQDNLENLPEF